MYHEKYQSPEIIALSAFAAKMGIEVVLTKAKRFAFLPANGSHTAKMFVPLTSSPTRQGEMAARMVTTRLMANKEVA